jgi:hypothetical protein
MEQVAAYPQTVPVSLSCSCLAYTRKAELHTVFQRRQAIDKKRENGAIHRSARSLSTTTNLK